MLEKLQAKKAALMEEEAMHAEAIKKIQSKMAIVDELIADESANMPIAPTVSASAPVSEAPAETTHNKVVTIRI